MTDPKSLTLKKSKSLDSLNLLTSCVIKPLSNNKEPPPKYRYFI